MKTTVSIFVLCAFIAFAQSKPAPQDVPPVTAALNRPFFNVFSAVADTANVAITGITNTGSNVVKSVAENTEHFIDSTAEMLTNRVNTVAENFRTIMSRPMAVLTLFTV